MLCITNYDFYASYVGIIMFLLVSCWISFFFFSSRSSFFFECLRLALSALSTAFLCSFFYFYLFFFMCCMLNFFFYLFTLMLTLPYLATYRSIFFSTFPMLLSFGEYISTAHNIKVEFLLFLLLYFTSQESSKVVVVNLSTHTSISIEHSIFFSFSPFRNTMNLTFNIILASFLKHSDFVIFFLIHRFDSFFLPSLLPGVG